MTRSIRQHVASARKKRTVWLQRWSPIAAVTLIVLFAGTAAPEAAAQAIVPASLHVSATAEHVHSRVGGLEDARAVGGRAAIAFPAPWNSVAEVAVGLAVAEDGRSLPGASLSARAYTPPVWRAAGFAEIGFAAFGRELNTETMLSGTGLQIGIGAEFFWKPHRSVVVAVRRWAGTLDDLPPEPWARDLTGDIRNLTVGVGIVLRGPRT